jgi:hypothetical protein
VYIGGSQGQEPVATGVYDEIVIHGKAIVP